MTVRVNPLIDRANGSPAPASGAVAAAMMPGAAVRVLAAALAALGYPVDDLLKRAGVTRENLDDPDALVGCEAYGRIVAMALEMRRHRNLGVRVAGVTPVGAFPLLDYLVLSCDRVGAGIHQLARYLTLVGSPTRLAIDETGDPVRVALEPAEPFTIEYTVGLLILHLREETGGAFRAVRATLAHRPDDIDELQRALLCDVIAPAGANEVWIDREAWQLPLVRRDPVLRAMLEGHPDATRAAASAEESIVETVTRLLQARVSGGDVAIGGVARALAVAPRTLQRKLADRGVTFHDLVETARKQAAALHVADRRLAIAEVGYLLGYSEPAAFQRAFRRWFGVAPGRYRASMALKP